ncbi:helix-turn-helix transcriptional regulator, partial [Oleiphilus sp. HI0066]|uniref:helix-turn-helix transcriptional regulator n=2 Tax=Oleiphilus TaxID=141450 RepID=UPI000ACE6DAE
PVYMMRRPETCRTLGKGRTAFYNDISKGLMTPGVAITSRTVAWPSDEVFAVMKARIAGKSEAELKELVQNLLERRELGEA